MHPGSEWAETVSTRIWMAPIAEADRGRLEMELEREPLWGVQGYLIDLWHGIRRLATQLHVYTKLKQV